LKVACDGRSRGGHSATIFANAKGCVLIDLKIVCHIN